MRRPRPVGSGRRPFALAGALLAAVVVVTSSATTASSGLALAGIPTTIGAKPISGVTDVTGVDSPNGTITLAQLQQDAPGTTVSASSVHVQGIDRGYLLIAPSQPKADLPLLVVLGGVNASPTTEAERDEFLPIVARGDAVLVYPAGYGQSWNVDGGTCCGLAATAGLDDATFVRAVIADVRSSRSITASYLVGFSNGGKLAYQLTCTDPDLFAAVAVVAATPVAACAAQQPRPMLIVAGAKDPALPADGSRLPAETALDQALSTWLDYNGCGYEPSAIEGVGTALTTTWSSCTSGSDVVGVLYGGLDHEWPGADLVGANVAGAGIIWSFLSSHDLVAQG